MQDEATQFEQARQLKGAEREEFLNHICAGKPDLRGRLESMLAASEKADVFFGENEAGTIQDATAGERSVTEGPSTIIGRYKLLQKIGEGGMGVVYMAEQTEPVTRKVALKIIKLGMDTRQVVARFEAERQALAMMDHPNIARVLDGGATESGRPYFVMELVQGLPITEFCDKNKLTARERLNLFIPVCQAIQSAHQKGIIHRDIKPSNVLITLNHGEPTPKVIDFGIAKATNQKLTEKTFFTNYATMIGTPAYMSPEQAEMTSMDVDTRTDVYSLGVLLYELLTGTTPFPEKRLRSAGYGEIQRIIAEEDPEKPSARLSTLTAEEKTAVAKTRGAEIVTLGKLLKGDLDWIVMKCLEKDRRRRYDTPNELAADLKRHLISEPVSAVAPTLSYQLQKLYQRNRSLVGMAGVVAVILVTATIVSTSLAIRARRAEQARAQEAENAKQQAAISEAVNRFLNEDLLSGADPNKTTDRNIKVREVLDRAAANIAGRFRDQPLVEAAIRDTIGSTYQSIGLWENAYPQFQRALQLQRAAAASQEQLIRAIIKASWSALLIEQFEENGLLAREALDLAVGFLPATNLTRVWAMHNVGAIPSMGRVPDAERRQAMKFLEDAFSLRQRLLGPTHRDTIESIFLLAFIGYGEADRIKALEPAIRATFEAAQKEYPPENAAYEMAKLAVAMVEIGKRNLPEAEVLLKEASETAFKRAPEDPFSFASLFLYANCLAAQHKDFEKQAVLVRQFREAFQSRGRIQTYNFVLATIRLAQIHLELQQPLMAKPLIEEGYQAVDRSEAYKDLRGFATQTMAVYFDRIGDETKGKEVRGKAIRLYVEDGQRWFHLCETFSDLAQALNSEALAWKAWQDDLARNPLDFDALYTYSIQALAFGSFSEYGRVLNEMVSHFPPSDNWKISERIVKTAMLSPSHSQKTAPEIRAHFDHAVRQLEAHQNDPDAPWIEASLALYHLREGLWNEALARLTPERLELRNSGFRRGPGYPFAKIVASLCHFKMGNLDQAKVLLEEASAYPPDSPTKWNQADPKTLNPDVLRYVTLRSEAERLLSGKDTGLVPAKSEVR